MAGTTEKAELAAVEPTTYRGWQLSVRGTSTIEALGWATRNFPGDFPFRSKPHQFIRISMDMDLSDTEDMDSDKLPIWASTGEASAVCQPQAQAKVVTLASWADVGE